MNDKYDDIWNNRSTIFNRNLFNAGITRVKRGGQDIIIDFSVSFQHFRTLRDLAPVNPIRRVYRKSDNTKDTLQKKIRHYQNTAFHAASLTDLIKHYVPNWNDL